ncbi:hypothetical protein O3P69_020367 [Scylla paramamosain]|uniref:HTH CENPB-type domain-containing protein n=1 Tax=Scylla paramamosain TaxID=85552 RepID=A0AAW0TNT2_SCYPA
MGKEGACQFSDGWLHRFKVRHGIRKLDISGESKSANLLSAEEFAKIVEEHNLTSEQIYNADETGLFYRCLSKNHTCKRVGGRREGIQTEQGQADSSVLPITGLISQHDIRTLQVMRNS